MGEFAVSKRNLLNGNKTILSWQLCLKCSFYQYLTVNNPLDSVFNVNQFNSIGVIYEDINIKSCQENRINSDWSENN